jgi:hypothetical protein
LRGLSEKIFRLAIKICPMEYEASRWLALFANQTGRYDDAIFHLTACLQSIPESHGSRVNLALNLIFRDGGQWSEMSKHHAKAAIFHAGENIRERFRISLMNTRSRDELMVTFEQLLAEVEQQRSAWRSRRKDVLKPQEFGGITHVEIRP